MNAITRFETASGSLYEIDHTAKTWARLRHAPESNFVRTPGGSYDTISEIVVGRGVRIRAKALESLDPDAIRMIDTTPVTRILA